jgi:hypothetical protein
MLITPLPIPSTSPLHGPYNLYPIAPHSWLPACVKPPISTANTYNHTPFAPSPNGSPFFPSLHHQDQQILYTSTFSYVWHPPQTPQPLNMKAISYYKMLKNNDPATMHLIQEDMDLQLINNTYNKKEIFKLKYNSVAMNWL